MHATLLHTFDPVNIRNKPLVHATLLHTCDPVNIRNKPPVHATLLHTCDSVNIRNKPLVHATLLLYTRGREWMSRHFPKCSYIIQAQIPYEGRGGFF